MTADKLVSIIIPVFNAESHIAATLSSIINQDYHNLEIIIVNDASSDSSRLIAENLLAAGSRHYKIIDHPQNLGVSAARNTGLFASQGEYVLFCDGDDICAENLASTLAGLLAKFDADLAFAGIVERFEDGRPDTTQRVPLHDPLPIDGEKALYMRMLNPIAPHTCCMMFRKELLTEHNIRFHEGCTAFEDIEFQLKAFCHAQRAAYASSCLYVYVHSSEMGSVRDNDTHAKKLRRYLDSSTAHLRAAEYLCTNAPSERTRYLAEHMLLPEAMIRKFTVCAKAGDKSGFDALLKDEDVRKILLSSWRVFFRKPEIFMKALAVLLLPGLYFTMRRNKAR